MKSLALAASVVFAAACSPDEQQTPPSVTAETPPPAAQSEDAPMTMRERWEAPTEPFLIIDNIYYVGTLGLGAFLFVGDEGHVLLDGGLPTSAPLIEANIQALGFELTDIRVLLNSHAHFDHSGGLAQLKADTGAQLAALEGDVSALEGGFYLGSESVTAMGAPPVKVDRILQDGDKIELPGIELIAHATPGHSRGCTSWGTTASAYGDNYEVLVFCSATVAANRLVNPPQYEGIVDDYRATFEKSKSMQVDIPLAPHPEFFSLLEKRDAHIANPNENQFISPAEFPTLMAQLEMDFDKALAEQIARAEN